MLSSRADCAIAPLGATKIQVSGPNSRGPDLWLYGTGGLAWTRFEQTVMNQNLNGTTITTTPSWRFGWVAGAGGELRLWNSNWLARLEYLHYDFGDSGSAFQGFNTTQFGLETDTLMTSRHLTADVVRAGSRLQVRMTAASGIPWLGFPGRLLFLLKPLSIDRDLVRRPK
ncbi:MAG: putative outer membrane protein [Bradyrhizobium sp.]|nr:putative outer membrane protein [Bradyrhizobium sp.]